MKPDKKSATSKTKKTFRDLASRKEPKGGFAIPVKSFDEDLSPPPPPASSGYHNGFGFKVAAS
jgi:hypothetical protein